MVRRTVVALLVMSSAALAQIPRLAPIGWGLTGGNTEGYTAGLDRQDRFAGTASAVLASKGQSSPGFGALSQCVRPDAILAKRVRFTAQVKTLGVAEWAGLWFRVEGSDGQMLAFDNMQGPDRRIHGDTQWRRYSVDAGVPLTAKPMASSNGKTLPSYVLLPKPRNLDFEE